MSSAYKICIAASAVAALNISSFGSLALAQNQASPLDQNAIANENPNSITTRNPDDICLSLKTALILSAKQDPAVAIARAQETEAEADIKTARSLFRPQVSAFARTGAGNVGLTDSILQNQVGVRASQRIFDFGDAKFARSAARFGFKASQFDLRQVQLISALNTGLAYLQVAQAQEQMIITQERRDFFAQQLASVDILLREGNATRTERANVASRLADAEASGLELQFVLDSAKTQVELDTGLLPEICDESDHSNLLKALTGAIPDRSSAVEIALNQNPNVEALKNRALELGSERKREKSSRFPIISVTGVSAFSSAGSITDLDQQNRVGLDVSFPLYSGNALGAANQRVGAQEAAAQGRVLELERQLTEEVSISYQRIESLSNQLISRKEVEKQSRLRFEAAQIEYNAGSRTLSDFIEVRLEFEQAAIQRVNVEYAMLRQQLEFLTLTAQLPIVFDAL